MTIKQAHQSFFDSSRKLKEARKLWEARKKKERYVEDHQDPIYVAAYNERQKMWKAKQP